MILQVRVKSRAIHVRLAKPEPLVIREEWISFSEVFTRTYRNSEGWPTVMLESSWLAAGYLDSP